MKRKFRTSLFIGLIVFVPTIIAFAAGRYYAATGSSNVPRVIPYQGHLDLNGKPADDVYSFGFQFFDAESAGNALSIKYSYPSVKVTGGSFNVDIGPVTEDEVFDSNSTYLEISVGGNALAPRQKINSVPFAVKAAGADSANKVEINAGGARYSTNAVFRGTSKGVTGGSFTDGASAGAFSYGGMTAYKAAKKVCETALGSETAHMCNTSEVVVSRQLGLNLNSNGLWVSTGTDAHYKEGSLGICVNDCVGWTKNDNPNLFTAIQCGDITCYNTGCANSYMLACCDY